MQPQAHSRCEADGAESPEHPLRLAERLARKGRDRAADLAAVRSLCEATDGVARVLDREQQRELGIDHERSGELVCIAEPGCWFAYHYWLDEARRLSRVGRGHGPHG